MASILIIEDEPQISRDIARILTRDGHDVSEASDGRQGIRRFSRQAPDIILTDLIMPNSDGLEVIAANRRLPRPSKLIVMTDAAGFGNLDYLKVAIELGADQALRKPLRLSELRLAIAICMNSIKPKTIFA